jgi:hypothetical protein
MARTALTAVTAARSGGTALGAGATPDATNGNVYASPGPFKSEIIIHNADASPHSVIVRASGYQGAPTGAANSGYVTDQYQPFAQASAGDLTFPVAATSYAVLGTLEGDRFAQADGSLWLDWSASTSMTVFVKQSPVL